MAVTTSSLGTNSKKITIEGETSPTNIISAIDDALTALGWTVYDTVSSGPRNTRVTKVFSAVNNDGPSPTTKYMILRYDFLTFKGYMTCCESWNTETHVATNESWHGDRNFPFPLHYGKCALYIFATQRYCVIQGSMRGALGVWQGIFEVERGEMPDDDSTNGSPCFGYTNAIVFGSSYGMTAVSSVFDQTKMFHNFWFPRTRDGYTGFRATKRHSLQIGGHTYPPPQWVFPYGSSLSVGSTGITLQDQILYGIGHYNKVATYAGNTSVKVVGQPKLVSQTADYHATGRIYGLKVVNTALTSNQLDTVTLPVNENYFYQANGSNTQHYIFSLGGGNPTVIGSPTAYNVYTRMAVNRTSIHRPLVEAYSSLLAGGTYLSFHAGVLVQGRYLYGAVSNTSFISSGANNASFVMKMDLDTMTVSNVALAGNIVCFDLKHDGETTLYGATSNGIIRIQLANNDNVLYTDNVGGNSSIRGYNIVQPDDNYVYFGTRNRTSGAIIVDTYAVNTFTQTSTVNATVSGVASVGWMILGNAEQPNTLFFGVGHGTGSGAHVFRYTPNNNTITANASYVGGNLSGVTGGVAYFNGEHIVVLPAGNTVTASLPQGNNFSIQGRGSIFTTSNVQQFATSTEANTLVSPWSGNSTMNTTANGTNANNSPWRWDTGFTFRGWRIGKSETLKGHSFQTVYGCTSSYVGSTNAMNTQYAVTPTGSLATFMGSSSYQGESVENTTMGGTAFDDGVNIYYLANFSLSTSYTLHSSIYTNVLNFGTSGAGSSSANTPTLPAILIPG